MHYFYHSAAQPSPLVRGLAVPGTLHTHSKKWFVGNQIKHWEKAME